MAGLRSAPPPSRIAVALLGNPNAGKTTLFNALTGARAHVGNYPGVTVDIAEGIRRNGDTDLWFTDLPGLYSLAAASPEEAIARDFLLKRRPDVVVQVVDSTNLERNLYLAMQMRESGIRAVVALTMADVARRRGIEVDTKELSRRLGAPVVWVAAGRGEGLPDLLAAITAAAAAPPSPPPRIEAPPAVAAAVTQLADSLPELEPELAAEYPTHWLAARLVEGEAELVGRLKSERTREMLDREAARIAAAHGDEAGVLMVTARYGWIAEVLEKTARLPARAVRSFSDRLDAALLHRFWGLPIFLVLMYAVFQFVFTLAEAPMEWISDGFARLARAAGRLWPKGAESPLRGLLVDGIIAGVDGVLVFLPNILLLFLAIAVLEGSGYMARAAFLLDRIMRRLGLHGKSFIPMLLGFGCTVPAIMAARTLENRNDRLATILVLPFMSCGARLPIYALIIPAFFPGAFLQSAILWLLYCAGIAAAILAAKFLRATLLKGAPEPFVMELPPYRIPSPRLTLLLMWERGKEYVKKAGTVILAACIVLWAMATYPGPAEYSRDYEGLAEAATREYLAAAGRLGAEAGLADFEGQPLLTAWARADLERRAAARLHWEDTPEYAEALTRHQTALVALGAADPGFPAFYAALRAMGAVTAEFGGRPAGMAAAAELVAARNAPGPDGEDGAPGERRTAAAEYEAALARLKNLDPAAYDLAAAYRDEALEPWRRTMDKLTAERLGEEMAHSVSGRIGRLMEPLIKPLGFDWRIGTALVGALAAKEVFVAQLGIVFAKGSADEDGAESLRAALKREYGPRQGLAIMLFCLLSTPCVATVAVCHGEIRSWKYALGMMAGLTAVAYVATLLFYQVAIHL